MSYTVLHMQKLKQPAIKGIQIHNQREKESQTNPDIDLTKSNLNYDLVNQTNIDYNQKINERIEEGVTTGKTIRKDAVRVASFLVTSDRHFFDQLSPGQEREFFESAYDFFCDKYGKENIAYATVHKDEKTPHMHVGFVPITEDGRLSAKDFFGKKQQLVKLQDEFHEHMQESGFDMERGISSDRKHIETARFKAETVVKLEQEAKEKYEKTMNQLHEIEDRVEMIGKIEPKKVLGTRMVKEEDYQMLMGYAKEGAAYKIQADNLQEELQNNQKEIVQLKSAIQKGQDKIRRSYKEIEKENEDLKENLDVLAEKKALKKVKNVEIVKKYEGLVEKYNGLVRMYNEQLQEKKNLKQKISDLNFQNRSFQNENRELKSENQSLKETILKFSKEFSAFKERVVKGLNYQFDRIKTRLSINNVDKDKIKFLDEDRKKMIEGSLKKITEPQKQKDKGLELER